MLRTVPSPDYPIEMPVLHGNCAANPARNEGNLSLLAFAVNSFRSVGSALWRDSEVIT
jgi:hypothetical protein